MPKNRLARKDPVAQVCLADFCEGLKIQGQEARFLLKNRFSLWKKQSKEVPSGVSYFPVDGYWDAVGAIPTAGKMI